MAVIDTVQGREALLQEDAPISAAIAVHYLTPAARIQIAQLAGARQIAIQNGLSRLHPGNLAAFEAPLNTYAPPATLSRLTALENEVAADTTTTPPFTAAQWEPVATATAKGYFYGGVNASEYEVNHDRHTALNAWRRVALSGGLGLLGLILSIVVSGLIGRRIIRRLRTLRESALTLANDQLPDVVARLRRGEDVPVEAAAPAPKVGRDEIGQVGQAFEAARQTAIQAAVGEARLRRGINDVFRSLARRSQSLLHRQLTALDQMERRTTDPETLEDLFRLDHLTTRMRRHAEGLIIMSGAAPGRGWVHPVRLIDVLRAAVAEVEDYSRVSVTCPSPAALTGPAVADVIHLLAELIENATTLSPSYTPVRVTGDLVANGFAVEIEDRGLGMSEQRYAELNARLAVPPEFDVFNSEQLGLFVVGQLAKRHGVQVTLRPSPFGGTTAIALIPTELVVLEEGYMEGLPAAMSAMSPARTTGRQALGEDTMVHSSAQRTQLTGQSWGALTQGPQTNGTSGEAAGGSGVTGTSRPGQGVPDPFDAFAPMWRSPEQGTSQQQPGTPAAGQSKSFDGDPSGAQAYGSQAQESQAYGSDQYGGQAHSSGTNENQAGYDWLAQPRDSGSPATGPAAGSSTPGGSETGGYTAGGLPSRAPSFGGTGQGETGSGGSVTGTPWSNDRPETAVNGTGQPTAYPSGPAEPTYPPAESYPQAGSPFPGSEPASPQGGHPYLENEPANNEPANNEPTYKGLPRRVRQASLAPQLRNNRAASAAAPAGTGESAVVNRSPEDIRTALSAMQRGWQQGRAPDDASRADSAPATADSSDPAASEVALSERAASESPTGDSGGTYQAWEARTANPAHKVQAAEGIRADGTEGNEERSQHGGTN
jgi:signal transduction histidine kinase